MQLLIDADLVAYRCAASVEISPPKETLEGLSTEEIQKLKAPDDVQEIAILRCDRLMQELLATTESDTYRSFLTGGNNFRKKINPDYKANRKDMIPPRFLQECREYLIKEWNSEISNGCEADDLLGIAQQDQTMIASLDKDLLMIPGWHYNWLHMTTSYTTPLDSLQYLYKQMLIGDVADNIVGVQGIGKVKAAKAIEPLETEQEMLETVLNLYKEDYKRFLTNIQCLWILQKEGTTWVHRVERSILPDPLLQEVDLMLNSMKSLMEDTSMGPIMNPQKTSGILVNGE